MKHKMILIVAAFVLLFVQSAFAQTEELPDTVWTKFSYPAAVNAVKFTPDGRFLASGGDDGIPKLWDAETGELVREFLGNETPIFSLDINNTGELLAGVNGSSILTIWNVQTGEIVKVIDHYEGFTNKQQGESVAFSNNGEYLAAILIHQGASYPERDVCLWKTIDWELKSQRKDVRVVRDLTFSPDDTKLALSNYVIGESQITVGILDVPNLNVIHIIDGADSRGREQSAFSPDGKYLATAINDSPNKIWNTSDWKNFREFGKNAISVAFSFNSQFVIFGVNTFNNCHLSIWDVELKQESNQYRLDWLAKKHWNWDLGDNAHSIDISRNSEQIAVAGSLGIYMLNAKWNPTTVSENPVQITEPLIFPNPTMGLVNIRFNLIQPSQVNIDIYDINSIKVDSIYEGLLESGLQNFQWNISHIPTGIYFAHITASGHTSTVKIIVNK